jgi:hypothetical protein
MMKFHCNLFKLLRNIVQNHVAPDHVSTKRVLFNMMPYIVNLVPCAANFFVWETQQLQI